VSACGLWAARVHTMKPMSRPAHDSDASEVLPVLRRRIEACSALKRRELGRWLSRLRRRHRSGQPVDRSLAQLEQALVQAEREKATRSELAGRDLSYPPELPVSGLRETIADAIRSNQVVVVCGETGSGKTTQLPKICLELGRGIDGRIGHTQPRRIAARSVAERIAGELGTELGQTVGWQVRFTRELSANTAIKLMTDGILLAETEHDPDLLAYDTIIIDEAHERSLNIDFLLGYLKRLLPRRPDLKVIVTSATIDAQRFSEHFGGCPVIEVSGRAHPVETRWRSVESSEPGVEDPSLQSEILDAVAELLNEFSDGDILVFLPGEREIREAIEFLQGPLGERVDLLPLYARLSSEQQQKIFKPGERRRVILATNVAETSITVPRIRGVIDSGQVRISRYSARSRVQRLPIEQVSQASATQRAGRCGRIGPGTCIRLYSEETWSTSEPFTQPEILRSNLAGVILRMLSLGLGDIDSFPFLERPSGRMVEEGWATLYELGAVDRARALTEVGRCLARLPIDPRIGRMLVASFEEGCLSEMLVVASVLSTQDPRLRPFGGEQAADFAHAPWRDEKSDFVGFLQIWNDYVDHLAEHGSSATRRWCQERYLSWVRVREWADTWRQLRELARDVFEVRLPDRVSRRPRDGGWGALHRSILSGLVSNLGRLDEDNLYATPSGGAFAIHPSSGLLHRKPPWVVAAEVVETTRRYGRICAKMRGDWVERVAPHLVRREYEEPHYLKDSGQVAAWERVHYGNLVVVPRRRVPYGPIDGLVARDVFIHEALVQEQLRTRLKFLEKNAELRRRIETLEEKGRRRDLLVSTEARFNFYDARIPGDVHSAPDFQRWYSRMEGDTPDLLLMRESDLLRPPGHEVDREAFPDRLDRGPMQLPLDYRHEPGTDLDGVVIDVPLAGLNQLESTVFEWLVPGMLVEKIEVLLRLLPKRIRTRFSPIKETAEGAHESLDFGRGDLFVALAAHLTRIGGVTVRAGDFDRERIPDHLRMRIRVRDDSGAEIAVSRDPSSLVAGLRGQATHAFRARVDAVSTQLERDGLTTFPDDELPLSVEMPAAVGTLVAWPAVVDTGESLGIRLLDSEHEAVRHHHQGVRRALRVLAEAAIGGHLDWLLEERGLEIAYAPLGSSGSFRRHLERLIIDAVFLADRPSVISIRSHKALVERYERGFPELSTRSERVVETVERALVLRNTLVSRFEQGVPASWSAAVSDMREQVEVIFPAAFPDRGWLRMRDAPRRLEALARRFERLNEKGHVRDERDRETLAPWVRRLEVARELIPGETIGLLGYEFAVDELRIHLAAPSLAGPGAASVRKLQAAWDAVRKLAPERLAALP
jgi:ATP-dependent helicase HrpA